MIETLATEHRFQAAPERGEVSALLLRPENSRWLLVLGHGASTGMRHPGMESLAMVLAQTGIATFRYQFPYMERGGGGMDGQATLTATVRSAVNAAAAAAPDLPLLAGGRSMGGRMTSLAAADQPLSGVRGLVFFAFPLHPAGKPGTERATHLAKVDVPLLFLQGGKDTLADLSLLVPTVERLGKSATLHLIEPADHSFHVLKRSGRRNEEVLQELAEVTRTWADGIGPL